MSAIRTIAVPLVLGCALLGTLAGCVVEEGIAGGDDHQVRRLEIQGGTTDNTHTSVVGIVIDVGGNQSICSGTLIAPNLVLTAQHCVAQLTSQYVICGETPFGAEFPPGSFHVTTQTTLPQDGSGYYSVSAVHVPPGGNDTCGFDIALLELTENVSADVTAPITPRIDVPIEEGDTYTAVGYGHIGNGTGAGTRRQLAGRQVLCGTGECPTNQGFHAREFAGTDGTCQGDSGGAALDDQGRVLGALSRGPEGCAGAVYSSVDAWASWLRDIGASAATAGGYTAPIWVSQGISEVPADDPDLDGIETPLDNCPDAANADQLDIDGDAAGDECDTDLDGDAVPNDSDNCPLHFSTAQTDNDSDGFGDGCDLDDDNDGILDDQDNCRFLPNATQEDVCFGDPSMGEVSDPTSPDGATFGGQPGPPGKNVGGAAGEDTVRVLPEPIHLEGRMSCSVGAGSPQDFGALALFVFGGLVAGRRRRHQEPRQ